MLEFKDKYPSAKYKKRIVLAGSFVILFSGILHQPLAMAQPASQTVGGVTQQDKAIEKQKFLETQIESERPSETMAEPQGVTMPESGPKVLINKINVDRSQLLSDNEIRAIVAPNEGKELSLEDVKKIAETITSLYRKKNFFTSYAYIPPQNLKNGVLLIKLIEGKFGGLEVKGNKYFSDSVYKKQLNMKPGNYFDYSALQKALNTINAHPDRKAAVVLLPGEEAETTDIVMNVEDKLPIHAGFGYDNYGSRFVEKNRFSLSLEHNNITGHDDRAFIKAQISEADYLRNFQASYLFPVTGTLGVGAYFEKTEITLGKEYKDIDAEGTADIYGVFFNKNVIQKHNLDLQLNGGFDYKSIKNYLSGDKTSRDALRIFKAGFNLYSSDRLGRNLVNAEINCGVPNILGGMDAKDSFASRAGSGAKFTKGVVDYYRLQPLPFSMTLLWKNYSQFTNNTLTASEQFQIGGPASVRGYPPGEYSGDNGYLTSLEWSFPVYFLPKNIKVPFRQEKIYDALKVVAFWDLGYVGNNTGENKTNTLKGYGFGTHFDVKDLSINFEMGYPIGVMPSDGKRPHPWVEFSYKF